MLIPIYWAISAFMALAYLVKVNEPASLSRGVLKTASIALLALIVVVEGGWILLVLALCASAAGDWFLSLRERRGLIQGIIAFAIAHTLYIVLFVNQEGGLGRDALRGVLQLCVLAGGGYLVYRLRDQFGSLRLPALAYGFILILMAVFALGLPPQLWPVSVGAVLFLLSDALLADEFFGANTPAAWRAPLVWALYWSGQAAITAGLLYPQH